MEKIKWVMATLLVLVLILSVEAYAEEEYKYTKSKEDTILARKLYASPGNFIGKPIILRCIFAGLGTTYLDQDWGDNFFSSKEYLEFYVWIATSNGDRIDYNFMKKNKGEILYELNTDDKITVYGKVVSSYKNCPWVEVHEIKKGWK